MARKSTTFLVFLVLLNGSATVLSSSGWTAAAGVTPNPAGDDAMDDVVDRAEQGFEPSAGIGQTLFALFGAALSLVDVLFQGIFAAPTMLANLGIPSWFIVPLFAPMYIVVVLDWVYVASGRDV